MHVVGTIKYLHTQERPTDDALILISTVAHIVHVFISFPHFSS
jgi:hypothetical protein